MRNRVLKQFLPGFIGLMLNGCQPVSPLTEHLHQYQQRLSRILDVPIVLSSPYTKITLTSPARLSFPETELTLNLSEFYQLEDCSVQPLIAQRNTTLGKIQLPSQRYLYEVELIALLQGCKTRQTLPIKAHQWLKKNTNACPSAGPESSAAVRKFATI